jgi:hypothetical protein
MKPNSLPLVLVTALLSVSAQAQSADKEKLSGIDRGFLCPESLPDDTARQEAVKQFILKVRDAWPGASVDDMIAFRKFLLKKHNCTKTLEAIERQDR